jgi:hypothetical protein
LIRALVRRSAEDAVADGAVAMLGVFLAVLALAAPAVSGAAVAAGARVVADLGLGGLTALTGAAGIGFGIRQVGVELRSRRAIAVLARPVPISVWIGAKLLGIGAVLAAMTAVGGAGTAVIAVGWGWRASPAFGAALLLAWAHAVVLTGVGMAASSLARPASAALAAAVVWLGAFLADDAAAILGGPALAWLMPAFDGGGALALVHAAAWTVVFGGLATWAVGRSDRG